MHRVTRLSYNSAGWTKPTGEARNSESATTYNSENGFGHEDWLFRNEWLIDGWRYAFIQGFNKSNAKLVKEGLPVDVTLFTVRPDKSRHLVASIAEVEALDDIQANDAVEAFRKRGWIDAMRTEIATSGGNASALDMSTQAKHVLNVRYRLQNLTFHRDDTVVPLTDAIYSLNRYMLYGSDKITSVAVNRAVRRRGSAQAPAGTPYTRPARPASEVTPEHARMQAILGKKLRQEFPTARIAFEENFVDITVETDDRILLFEVKSDLDPRSVLRQAIGQLLEYGYHPRNTYGKPVSLVVVGRVQLGVLDREYIDRLATMLKIPLSYRWIEI
jgi:hypothetical protein